ncbi:terminase [Stenotrophomonas sp. GD03958]|uniref:terminase n=1 Tax=Stenotrophomonas sp. GD03958 TaxID=2975411 RepID=UPI0024474403|nr:terminase [Stenotrophomonas sp. GD03958]MDH1192513.1 terminase [Stenotrophomonas sp. GD03958]
MAAPRKPKAEAKATGRPSAYKAEYAKQAEKLCLLGATDQEIADFFEVNVRTVYRWKGQYPDFCQALKAGKDQADERVERSLYQQAIGYEQDEVKIFMPAGAESPVYAEYRAKVAPNVTAAIFWLKNRRRNDWRDRIDHANDPTDPLPAPQFIVAPVEVARRKE